MKIESTPDPLDISAKLPALIAILAWGGGVLATFLVPLVFLAIGYQSEVARLETALYDGIHSNTKQVRPQPSRKGEPSQTAQAQAQAQEILATLGWLGSETRIRISTESRLLLSKQDSELPAPLLTRTAPLTLGDDRTGQLELSRSLRSLLVYTLLMFVPGLALGAVVFFLLRDLPLRAFQRALQEVAIRKATEEQLAKSLSIFSATLESTADGILVTDTQGREIVSNQRFREMWNLHRTTGRPLTQGETLGELVTQLREPAVFSATLKDLTKHIDVNNNSALELRDGRLFEWNSQPQFVDGKVVGRVTSFRDVSDRKRAEALLGIEKEVLEMVVCGQDLKAALSVLADHVEVLSGEMFCAIMFRQSGEGSELDCATGRGLPGNIADDIVHHGHDALNTILADIARSDPPLTHGLSDEFSGVMEDICHHPVWHPYCDLVTRYGIQACFAVAIHSSRGELLGLVIAHYRNPARQRPHDRELVWVANHLTSIAIERRRSEDRLQIMAHYDALTHLPNRVLFHDRLDQALARAERNSELVALMFLDLDRFKTINDTLGHEAGDLLLREVSARLRLCIREVDTVARLGGDEFTVILEQLGKAEDAATVATKIIEALAAAPILLGNQEAFATPSIGITVYPLDGYSVELLLKNADTAMYRAKEDGGNGYRFFTAEMNTLAIDRLELESGLRRALERQEFIIYYQPKLHLGSGKIIGAEALLRWKHPVRGLVSPGEFIPILEETGLIEQVGTWVLRTVCQQIGDWQTAGLFPPPIVAVNLSARQLQRSNLADIIADILEETGIDPRLLELEVTESMLMHDPKCAIDLLMQIRNKGILHIDVDDFGTGYSSLSYLKQFPIDCLKLDKSFVDGLPDNEDDIAISRAVLALAHSLRLTVIAEGVETREQLDFLRDNGCDIVQGYFIGRPLPAEDFARLAQEHIVCD